MAFLRESKSHTPWSTEALIRPPPTAAPRRWEHRQSSVLRAWCAIKVSRTRRCLKSLRSQTRSTSGAWSMVSGRAERRRGKGRAAWHAVQTELHDILRAISRLLLELWDFRFPVKYFSMSRFPSRAYGSLLLLLTFAAVAAVPDAAPIFREVPPQESGVTWIHHNGFSPNHYLPESTGPGVAIFDYNNDGLMDILLVDSGTSAFYKPDLA